MLIIDPDSIMLETGCDKADDIVYRVRFTPTALKIKTVKMPVSIRKLKTETNEDNVFIDCLFVNN